MNDITFIIPTIGRTTLINSIKSLLNQSINDWNAIIIFDNVTPNIELNNILEDKRIKIVQTTKLGENINSAGNVRNYGISLANTKWIAFLDDDDIISNDYIEVFYNELKILPDLDVIIFRMKLGNRYIPQLKVDNFYICDVGISFIIKKKIYDNGLKFVPNSTEDFLYLDQIRSNKYKMVISPYIKYFVRSESNNDILPKGNRVLINYNSTACILYIGYKNLFSKKLENTFI